MFAEHDIDCWLPAVIISRGIFDGVYRMRIRNDNVDVAVHSKRNYDKQLRDDYYAVWFCFFLETKDFETAVLHKDKIISWEDANQSPNYNGLVSNKIDQTFLKWKMANWRKKKIFFPGQLVYAKYDYDDTFYPVINLTLTGDPILKGVFKMRMKILNRVRKDAIFYIRAPLEDYRKSDYQEYLVWFCFFNNRNDFKCKIVTCNEITNDKDDIPPHILDRADVHEQMNNSEFMPNGIDGVYIEDKPKGYDAEIDAEVLREFQEHCTLCAYFYSSSIFAVYLTNILKYFYFRWQISVQNIKIKILLN